MADYIQPEVVNKRVRYFDGQFLQDQDFIDEQKYHLDRERRQSRLLRVTGIVEGLMVTAAGPYQITVARGVAVDSLGRQLVLATETNLRLTDRFAKKQGIEVYLVHQENPTDVAQTGGKGARRWDESPKIAALAADGTVAVAPDGVSSTWEGPTVLLARLAVADNGTVTVDGAAGRKAGLFVPGAVGIGTTNPVGDLEIGDFDARNRYLALKVQGGNQYRSGVRLWAWQENYGYSVEYDERWATGNGLHVRTHDRNADGTTRLFVGWNGNVGVGTTGPAYKLTVGAPKEHLQLRREKTETEGGKQLFLELYQDDPDPKKLIPEVFPGIRFHHNNRFWHRIEAQSSGFHFKDGNLAGDGYSDIRARNIYATGKLEVTGGGGMNVDLLVNGRLRSNNNDGGLWVTENRFVGGHATDQIGFWNNNAWRLTVQRDGNVGIGTISPSCKLTVSSGSGHLQLRREKTETEGGKQLFLELYQDDPDPKKLIPEVFPSIRFHHNNRFWHRIEAQGGGFHFKVGNMPGDDYVDIKANNVFSTGNLYFHPSANWGFEDRYGAHTRRYWYIARPNWNLNDFSDGAPTLKASGTVFPSDLRLKDDTTEITAALEKIERIRGVSFVWNVQGLRHLTDDVESMVSAGPEASAAENRLVWDALRAQCHTKLARRNIGLIAQEVEQVAPELVYTDAGGYKCVDYSKLTALLVQAVKEQQSAIAGLRTRLAALERSAR